MRTTLLISLIFLTVQITSGQSRKDKKLNKEILKDTIDGVYIPKNLEDCFKQINSFLDDSAKVEIKKWTEDEFAANTHFGLGLWMRNNWGLWGGSRLSKYFNDLKIHHPDDMSGIIITSYHRYLTERKINLKKQVEYYNAYWEAGKEPTKKQYPRGVKNLELGTKFGYNSKENDNPRTLHIQTNSKSDKVWIYDNHFGWLQITNQELTELEKVADLEEALIKLFDKR